MDEKTRVNAVIESASFVMGILANPANGDLQLLDVDALPLPEDTALRFRTRGLAYVGIISFDHGALASPSVTLEVALSDQINDSVVKEFSRIYGAAMAEVERSLMGDSLSWLARLAMLPDTRPKVLSAACGNCRKPFVQAASTTGTEGAKQHPSDPQGRARHLAQGPKKGIFKWQICLK